MTEKKRSSHIWLWNKGTLCAISLPWQNTYGMGAEIKRHMKTLAVANPWERWAVGRFLLPMGWRWDQGCETCHAQWPRQLLLALLPLYTWPQLPERSPASEQRTACLPAPSTLEQMHRWLPGWVHKQCVSPSPACPREWGGPVEGAGEIGTGHGPL